MSSILFQKIRTRLGLAYAITCEIELYEEGGVFMIYAGTDSVNTKKVVIKSMILILLKNATSLVLAGASSGCLDSMYHIAVLPVLAGISMKNLGNISSNLFLVM